MADRTVQVSKSDELLCVLCNEKIEGFGNNAQPLMDGKCCDKCNVKVIAERTKQVAGNEVKESQVKESQVKESQLKESQ